MGILLRRGDILHLFSQFFYPNSVFRQNGILRVPYTRGVVGLRVMSGKSLGKRDLSRIVSGALSLGESEVVYHSIRVLSLSFLLSVSQ